MLADVTGQDEGVQYLRLVIEGKLRSPLLLVGPSGVGRRFSVVEAAKEAFYETDPQVCPQCYQLSKGIHPDFKLIQPEKDNKEIKVEYVRELLQTAAVKPSYAPWKFLVIDGADRLTDASANALLKTLEEAPETVRFFLLAEESKRVIPTIRSRCVEVRYRRLPESFVVGMIGGDNPSSKPIVCCRLEDGSLGRAARLLLSGHLSLRDQMFGILKTGLTGDIAKLFSAIDSLDSDLAQALHFLEHLVCDLYLLPFAPDTIANLDLRDALVAYRTKLGEAKLPKLREAVFGVVRLSRGPYNLPFHLKTALASAFV